MIGDFPLSSETRSTLHNGKGVPWRWTLKGHRLPIWKVPPFQTTLLGYRKQWTMAHDRLPAFELPRPPHRLWQHLKLRFGILSNPRQPFSKSPPLTSVTVEATVGECRLCRNPPRSHVVPRGFPGFVRNRRIAQVRRLLRHTLLWLNGLENSEKASLPVDYCEVLHCWIHHVATHFLPAFIIPNWNDLFGMKKILLFHISYVWLYWNCLIIQSTVLTSLKHIIYENVQIGSWMGVCIMNCQRESAIGGGFKVSYQSIWLKSIRRGQIIRKWILPKTIQRIWADRKKKERIMRLKPTL